VALLLTTGNHNPNISIPYYSTSYFFLYKGDISLNLDTVLGMTSNAQSTPSWVVPLPNVRTRDPWACSCFNPRAIRTCDGSRVLEEHAEPVDAEIPSISRFRMMLSPSM
jgi:hypothetical protein